MNTTQLEKTKKKVLKYEIIKRIQLKSLHLGIMKNGQWAWQTGIDLLQKQLDQRESLSLHFLIILLDQN